VPFRIEFTQFAADHVRGFRKFEQQLRHQPATETRNRMKLSANELSGWELREDRFRAFYNVVEDGESRLVIIAIGQKEHNVLYVGGKEVRL
jgi:hypothetical protein